MVLLSFIIGLLVGLALTGWSRSQSDTTIKTLLHKLTLADERSGLSPISRLSMAIEAQRETLQQLEQQLESYKQILHTAPIGYLQVDDENQLTWCNAQARHLLDITHDQAKPRLLLEVVRSYELDQLIEQTRNSGKPYQSDWTFFPASPDHSQLSQQRICELRGNGFPLAFGHVGIFLENRQETVTLMQQRDRWASDVAHELKTPLTSIRLVAETLQSRLDLPLRGWVDRLVNETIRLSTLVQDLLDLSQLDRGSFHALQLKKTDLAELIQAAWLNLEPLARKKQLQLIYSGPEHLLIQSDEPRLYRVLINLLDNAIKYSPPWQQIQVNLSLEKPTPDTSSSTIQASLVQHAHLEVIDAGHGFADSDLPHVFERFYRSDPSRSRSISSSEPDNFSTPSKRVMNVTTSSSDYGHDQSDLQQRGGNGLGLAIVKQIVEAHSGYVTASNHPETGGAWLQVYLPWQHLE